MFPRCSIHICVYFYRAFKQVNTDNPDSVIPGITESIHSPSKSISIFRISEQWLDKVIVLHFTADNICNAITFKIHRDTYQYSVMYYTTNIADIKSLTFSVGKCPNSALSMPVVGSNAKPIINPMAFVMTNSTWSKIRC